MGQKTTAKVSFKVDNSYLTQENQDQEFLLLAESGFQEI